jgi:hypothetical protein
MVVVFALFPNPLKIEYIRYQDRLVSCAKNSLLINYAELSRIFVPVSSIFVLCSIVLMSFCAFSLSFAPAAFLPPCLRTCPPYMPVCLLVACRPSCLLPCLSPCRPVCPKVPPACLAASLPASFPACLTLPACLPA